MRNSVCQGEKKSAKSQKRIGDGGGHLVILCNRILYGSGWRGDSGQRLILLYGIKKNRPSMDFSMLAQQPGLSNHRHFPQKRVNNLLIWIFIFVQLIVADVLLK
jgi:hypothetical protein